MNMRKRIPVEKCRRLMAREVRKKVSVGDETVRLDDGLVLKLRWNEVKGVWAGSKSIAMVCTGCGVNSCVLYQAPGRALWQCYKCVPISYQSERRSGPVRGARPLKYVLAQIEAHQQACVEMLGLAEWPLKKAFWTWEDILAAPRKPEARRITAARKEALAKRLDAWDALRVCALTPGGNSALIYNGETAAIHKSDLRALRAAGQAMIKATAWSTRRRAPRFVRPRSATS